MNFEDKKTYTAVTANSDASSKNLKSESKKNKLRRRQRVVERQKS